MRLAYADNCQNKSITLRCITAAFFLILISSLSFSTHAQANASQSETVRGIQAYALFKSGNYSAARAIWESLAEKGNTTAIINLANLFQQGFGVNRDNAQAIVLIQKAAELGDARAQYELGIEYEKGLLLHRDINKAAEWLLKSARQENADGQYSYAIMLATTYGEGIEKTTSTQRQHALMWLTKAKENGHPDAREYIKLLRNMNNAAPTASNQ